MNEDLFNDDLDYWRVVNTLKEIYLSDGSLSILLDFEGVLDEVDLYAFRNWILGELVEGPIINRYTVTCTFLWPAHLMPDPRGALRLIPFDCQVKWKKTVMKVPVKVKKPEDYQEDAKKAKLREIPIWLVSITIPKELITDIRSGSIELEGEEIDLGELDASYEEDLDDAGVQNNTSEELSQEEKDQEDLSNDPFSL